MKGGLVALLCGSVSPQALSPSPENRLCTRVCGLYEVVPGWVIAVSVDEGDLVYQDFHSGKLGILKSKPGTTDTFTGGPTLSASTPEVLTFKFSSAEATPSLQFEEQGRPSRTARRVAFSSSDIVIQSGAIRLVGTVVARQGSTRRPAIVLIPGGGPQKRDLPQAWWWAYHGFRVLTYDKRGTGASSGKYREAAISDLAEDVKSAVAALRKDLLSREEIGVVGHSEAGFVAPVVASAMPELAFVIVLAAPVSAMSDQILHEIESGMACDGFPPTAIANAKALRSTLNRAVLANADWASLQQAIQVAESEKWFRAARVNTAWKNPTPTMIDGARRYLDFDPASYWKLVKSPVLAVYAETDSTDSQVPAEESRRKLESLFASTNKKNATITVYSKANHTFLEGESGCDSEFAKLSRIVPGYYQALAIWAIGQVGLVP